jgi:hypothetical protein
MKFRRYFLVLGLVGLSGCSQESQPPENAGGGAPAGENPPIEAPVSYNIGDVETSLRLTVTVAPRSQRANVEYMELQTKKFELAMAEAHITKPYPEELWLTAGIDARRALRPQDAIVLRLRIYAEGREAPVAQKDVVWTGSGKIGQSESLDVDIVPQLDSLATSVLVHARAEILWFAGTDAASIDPANVTQTPAGRVEKLSNTLRISFE